MKNKKNVNEQEFFSQLLNSIPDDVKEAVSLSMAIASQINSILKRKNISQREFAALLGKKESEISKWLSGSHTFTTKTLGKIHAVLKEPIITVPIYTKPEVKFVPVLSFSFSEQVDNSTAYNEKPEYSDIPSIANFSFILTNSNCQPVNS